MYGISPVPQVGGPADFGLRPVMTLAARLASVKQVPGGHGVSYGHHYVTPGRDDACAGPAGVRRRRAAACVRRGPGPGGRQVADGGGTGGDGPVRGGPRRRRRGRGRRGAAVRPRRPGRADRRGLGAGCGTIAYEIVTRIGAGCRGSGTSEPAEQRYRASAVSTGVKRRPKRAAGRWSRAGLDRRDRRGRRGRRRRRGDRAGHRRPRRTPQGALALDAAGPYGTLRGTPGHGDRGGRHRAVLRGRRRAAPEARTGRAAAAGCSAAAARRRRRRDRGLQPRLLPQPGLLALPAGRPARRGPRRLLGPAQPRPLRARAATRRRATRSPSTSSAAT